MLFFIATMILMVRNQIRVLKTIQMSTKTEIMIVFRLVDIVQTG